MLGVVVCGCFAVEASEIDGRGRELSEKWFRLVTVREAIALGNIACIR